MGQGFTGADGTALGAAGANALSGIPGLVQAGAQADTIRTQGRIAELQAGINKQLALTQAADIKRIGDSEAQQRIAQSRDVQASQKAAFAGQGILTDTGTAAQVQGETRVIGEIDAIRIRNNARRAAAGLETEALNEEYGGRIARISSQAAARQTLAAGGIQFANKVGQSGAFIANRYGFSSGKRSIKPLPPLPLKDPWQGE